MRYIITTDGEHWKEFVVDPELVQPVRIKQATNNNGVLIVTANEWLTVFSDYVPAGEVNIVEATDD